MESRTSETITWLAKSIFQSFPGEVTGLRFYLLACGCIYYQRIFRNGDLDPTIGAYRDADNGPCDSCMNQKEAWENRILDEMVVYNTQFEII